MRPALLSPGQLPTLGAWGHCQPLTTVGQEIQPWQLVPGTRHPAPTQVLPVLRYVCPCGSQRKRRAESLSSHCLNLLAQISTHFGGVQSPQPIPSFFLARLPPGATRSWEGVGGLFPSVNHPAIRLQTPGKGHLLPHLRLRVEKSVITDCTSSVARATDTAALASGASCYPSFQGTQPFPRCLGAPPSLSPTSAQPSRRISCIIKTFYFKELE